MLGTYQEAIALALLINLLFHVIIYILGRIFSNQYMLRYFDLGIKEWVIILVFVIFTYALYDFIYNRSVDPNFILSIFHDSSIGGSSGSLYLSNQPIYNNSINYVRYMINLSNNLLYMLVEGEGKLYHFSSFSCTKCASDMEIGGFDLGCFLFPTSLAVYSITPYTNYVEPAAQSFAAARNSLELSIKMMGFYYAFLNLASTPSMVVLLAFGIILRLIPGMKFAGNSMMAIAFVIIIILPTIIYLQSNIFYNYVFSNVDSYYKTIKTKFYEKLPPYIAPNLLTQGLFTISNIFVNPSDPCSNIVHFITVEYDPQKVDFIYKIKNDNSIGGALLRVLSAFATVGLSELARETYAVNVEIYDSEIKRAYQSIFLVSTFSLSTTIVAMIIAAKGIVTLLGERFSFLDLFLRVV
ncbi:MAG: hypothetical protein QXU27_00595 [Candidatus Anstonellales archaeon]